MLKKLIISLTLLGCSFSTLAFELNDIVQNFPVQINSEDQSIDGSNDKVVLYNNAYTRNMNQLILNNLNNNSNNINNNINSLYDFAGMVFTSTSLEDIKDQIKGSFNLSIGNSKYLYQEQANIYSLIVKGNSPSIVKNYINTNSFNVLSKISNRNSGSNINQSQNNQESSSSSSSSYNFNY